MFFNSIRWRLQVWHGLILLAVLAGFGTTAYHLAWNNQLHRIDQELEQQAMVLLRPERQAHRFGPPQDQDPVPPEMGRPGRPHEPRAFANQIRASMERNEWLMFTNALYIVLWQDKADAVIASPGAPNQIPRPLPPDSTEEIEPPSNRGPERPPMGTFFRTRDQYREFYRFLPQGGCMLAGRSIGPDLAALNRFAIWLGAAGAGILVIGLAGGWWLSTRAIRPIDDISATALKIAAGDLSQRINATDAGSELGRLAGVLNSTFARLEASFAHQARFTADASHELRTPISVILTQSQIALSREREAQEYKEALEACQRAAQRMRHLAESLLALARLDAGQEPMKQDRFDLARIAADCVELIKPLAGERQIDIQCDLTKTECLGDSGRISQVITNLLTNAIHFNRDEGVVRVRVAVENGIPLISVSDSGDGIPLEDLPHIFERFYRADKSRARRQGRNGLGLAICKAIVDAHSGVIEVQSKVGEGSTFTVKLIAAK